MDWLVVTLENSKLVFGSEGRGKDELFAALNGISIAFGGFRLDNNFLRFQLVDENAGAIKRGKAVFYRNAIFNVFEGPASELTAESMEDFMEKVEGLAK